MGISACLRGKHEGPTPGRQHADLDMRRAILISRTYILALESFMMIPGYRMMATHSNDRDVGRKYFSDESRRRTLSKIQVPCKVPFCRIALRKDPGKEVL